MAGGLGTRLGEETSVRPKPMVEIGGMPIIWHIMKIYSAHGVNDFIICLGYKGYMIKEFFANYFLHMSDVTIDLRGNAMEVHQARSEPWRVTLVDTGATTMTGGRLGAIRQYLDPGEPFCFTYGDGVADIDVADLVRFHKAHGLRATITSVTPCADSAGVTRTAMSTGSLARATGRVFTSCTGRPFQLLPILVVSASKMETKVPTVTGSTVAQRKGTRLAKAEHSISQPMVGSAQMALSGSSSATLPATLSGEALRQITSNGLPP